MRNTDAHDDRRDVRLLRPVEVAKALGVNRKYLDFIDGLPEPYMRLPGGHRRWSEADIFNFRDSLRGAQSVEEPTDGR